MLYLKSSIAFLCLFVGGFICGICFAIIVPLVAFSLCLATVVHHDCGISEALVLSIVLQPYKYHRTSA